MNLHNMTRIRSSVKRQPHMQNWSTPLHRPTARWWAALLVILAVGSVFYLTGYDRGLPLYESRDERRNLEEVFILRGLSDAELWKPGYPPGILWVNHGAQVVTEWAVGEPATDCPCDVIRTMRLLGIPFHLASAVLIALIARKLGGDWAGLFATSVWLFSAGILDQTQYAFPQTYEHIGYLLAFWFAWLALENERPRWAVASTLAGLIAVIFKYTAFPILGLGVGVALWLQRKEPSQWRITLAVQFAFIAACAMWLFFGYGATQLIDAGHEETTNVVQGETLTNIFDPSLVIARAHNLTAQLGVPLWIATALLIVGIPLYWRQHDVHSRLALLALIGIVLFQLLTVILTLAPNFDGLRQNIPATGVLAVLLTLTIGAIVQWARQALPTRLPVGAIAAGIIVGLCVMPQFWGAWQHIQYRRLPVSYAAFARWSVETLPIDFVQGQPALLTLDDRPFTTPWTCDRFPYFPAVVQGDLSEQSVAAWQAQDVAFAQLDSTTLTPDMDTSNFTLVADFPARREENQWRTWRRGLDDHRLRVYHLLPIQRETNAVFGEQIRLHGYTLPQTSVTAGEPLTLWLYWQALIQPTADYQVYIHITPPDDRQTIVAQGDAPPTGNPRRPTSTWYQPGEHTLPGYFEVMIPPDVEPADYQMVVGLYNRTTGERLTTQSGADAVTIPLTITPAD